MDNKWENYLGNVPDEELIKEIAKREIHNLIPDNVIEREAKNRDLQINESDINDFTDDEIQWEAERRGLFDEYLENVDTYILIDMIEKNDYVVTHEDDVKNEEEQHKHEIEQIFYGILEGKVVVKDLTLREDLDRLFEWYLNRNIGQYQHEPTERAN